MELIIENGVLKRIIGECRELTIPEGVTEIGDHVCFYKTELEKLTIPEGVTVIREEAFRSCSALRDVVLPESLTEVGRLAFYGCSGIKQINFPKNLKTIHSMAFAFTGIINLIVPETVEFMAGDAFHPVLYPLFTNESREDFFAKFNGYLKPDGCVCLKKGVLENYTSTPWGEEIYIPFGVRGITNTAFDRQIMRKNFYRWNVKKIYLPTTVRQIGKMTFSKCKDITLCACSGSYAEKYARERGLAFEAVEYL
ncbi:MAG: leucine-rich repeat domain-containing protein [Clostridia bacterium]|nr:leucine-rich repeat domain-containing protein [Clostridia bacterium]